MSKITDFLEKSGIADIKDITRNPSYDQLFSYETDKNNTSWEKGTVTNFGAVSVKTGKFTGRSPNDKYIVSSSNQDIDKNVWWHKDGSDNKPISVDTFDTLKALSIKELSGKKLYVVDGFCGARKETRMAVRLVCEVSWQAHFFKNMFIEPTQEELDNFKPDWTILNSSKTVCKNYKELGLNSENFVAFNIEKRLSVIGGTWYGGEMKKGIFSIMNYFLPLNDIGSFHCSANADSKDGSTALFFGLSGTGKTTLSSDKSRDLIGDDEIGWDDNGIFNLEGGCYAKTINLSKDKEPEIYGAIKRDALLENVGIHNGNEVDFDDVSITQNTRVSYPIDFIPNAIVPSVGKHPKNVIFLVFDAFGVLPPVSILTEEQIAYYYLVGYTAKIPGTELGVTEPEATFSTCFAKPFLLLKPQAYSDILVKKIKKHQANVFLVNTGWVAGPYGSGHRISIKDTRAIVHAIIDGKLKDVDVKTDPIFNLSFPVSVPGLDNNDILDPKHDWQDKEAYDKKAHELKNKCDEVYKKMGK